MNASRDLSISSVQQIPVSTMWNPPRRCCSQDDAQGTQDSSSLYLQPQWLQPYSCASPARLESSSGLEASKQCPLVHELVEDSQGRPVLPKFSATSHSQSFSQRRRGVRALCHGSKEQTASKSTESEASGKQLATKPLARVCPLPEG